MDLKAPIRRFRDFYSKRKFTNLFQADGAVPFHYGLFFSLESVLVMVLCNVTPILAVFSHFGDSAVNLQAIQSSFLWAGVSTIIGVLTVWIFGSGLPIIAGISFTFMGSLSLIASNYDYGTTMGSLLVGSLVIIVLSFFAKYLSKIIKPIVRAVVIIAVGLGLIGEAVEGFFSLSEVSALSGSGIYDFSLAWPYLIPALLALFFSLFFSFFLKGIKRYLSVASGLLAGYLSSLIIQSFNPGLVLLDFSGYTFSKFTDFINIPRLISFSGLKFVPGPIIFVSIIYLISATEDIGNYSLISLSCLDREPEAKAIRGGLLLGGTISFLSACFGSLPITVSSQNAGFTVQSGVKNRNVFILSGAFLILIGFLPPIGVFLISIPRGVLAGSLIPIYLSILIEGFSMFFNCGTTIKNSTIVSIAIGLGYGVTLLSSFFTSSSNLAAYCKSFWLILLSNPEATMFIIAFILSYVIPDRFNKTRREMRDQEELEIAKKEIGLEFEKKRKNKAQEDVERREVEHVGKE